MAFSDSVSDMLDVVASTSSGPSLECATMAKVSGAPAAMAIVERLTVAECGFRSVATFACGDLVSFELTLHGAAKVLVRGHILSLVSSGPRNQYRLKLDDLSDMERASIARALAEAASRRGNRATADVPSGNGLTRSSIRVPANFRIRFAVDQESFREGRVTNISNGGILMVCDDEIPVGSSLLLRFSLPRGADLAPSPEVSIKARIVAHPADASGTNNYNVAFHNVTDLARAQIVRFIENSGHLGGGDSRPEGRM